MKLEVARQQHLDSGHVSGLRGRSKGKRANSAEGQKLSSWFRANERAKFAFGKVQEKCGKPDDQMQKVKENMISCMLSSPSCVFVLNGSDVLNGHLCQPAKSSSKKSRETKLLPTHYLESKLRKRRKPRFPKCPKVPNALMRNEFLPLITSMCSSLFKKDRWKTRGTRGKVDTYIHT